MMIDYEQLNLAYGEDRFYALQLEVGDVCHQGCIYCYMNALPGEKNRLSDAKISNILYDSQRLGISAIEWLGGEPLLRESVFEHMARARDYGFRNNIWTGGLPLAEKEILEKTARYCRHGLIALHVSTVDPKLYESLHYKGSKKDLELILEAVRELLETGYPSDQILNSVTYTGLQLAEDMVATIDYFEEKFGIKTSVNIYHTYLRPGTADSALKQFIPDRKSVARVYKRFSEQYGIKEFPMNCVNKQYCSATLAVLCDGSVTPCATIRPEGAPNINQSANLYDIVSEHRDELIFKKFKNPDNLPRPCRKCRLSEICWGCRSRAYAAGLGIYGPDPRCFRSKVSV